uniref:Uncharacterized protein n=1 Tax=Marseillevirus LCMAC101 TaxID=2506602 RepID=A0A481YQD6_9VIRU|nr:MAG: hypothetical protein LCMAC101_00500 [Marseillevirus LCMAC101]
MNTNIQVTSTEYNLKLSGELSLYVSGSTIKVTCGSTKFETLMRGAGKITIEWYDQDDISEDTFFQIPAWDSERKILVDKDRFIYTFKGEVYGKVAQEGGGLRPLNSAERAILTTKNISICESIISNYDVKLIRDSVRKEKNRQSQINEFKDAFVGGDSSEGGSNCLEYDGDCSYCEHEELRFTCNKCCDGSTFE